MSGLFEHMAATESMDRTASRKALALARTRTERQFASFIRQANDKADLEARLSYVEADLMSTVKQACAELGYTDWEGVYSSIRHSYDAFDNPEFADPQTGVGGDYDKLMQQPPDPQGNLEPGGNLSPSQQAAMMRALGDLGISPDQALAELQQGSLTKQDLQYGTPQHMRARTAVRKPKMCPYHREVTDISLASGDPASGFNAMAQHAWSANHCQGEGYEGRCNFKPEMTTQSYWDNKQEQSEQRRQDRQQQMEAPQVEQTFESPTEEPAFDHQMPDGGDTPEPMSDMSEPSAVGMGEADRELVHANFTRVARAVPRAVIHGANMNALNKIAEKKPGLAINGTPWHELGDSVGSLLGQPVEVSHPNPQWEDIAARVIEAGHDQPLRDFFAAQKAQRAQQAPPAGGPPPMQPPMQASTREAEALKTIDVDSGDVGPVPTMDKGKWKNMKEIDSEMPGSPVPTRRQDIMQAVEFSTDSFDGDDGRFEQTNAVLEKQDVTQGSELPHSGQGGTQSGGITQAKPVTSTVDPDTNPIREHLLREQEENERS